VTKLRLSNTETDSTNGMKGISGHHGTLLHLRLLIPLKARPQQAQQAQQHQQH